jgi:structural maintenance of chromosome 4
MKSKTGDENNPGLLEYLEDIIGSNTFNSKIIEEEKLFDNLSINRREKAELVKISEEELKKLDDEKNLAVDYVKAE